MQGHILDKAKGKNPDPWWWIKADGCDILQNLHKGLDGDVDLDNGDLEEQKAVYRSRLSRIEKLHIISREYVTNERVCTLMIFKQIESFYILVSCTLVHVCTCTYTLQLLQLFFELKSPMKRKWDL